MNQLTAEQIQSIKVESDQHRAAFHRAWKLDIEPHSKCDAVRRMPNAMFAEEIAWRAYRAGRQSVALVAETKPKINQQLESWVPLKFRFGSWSNCFYCGEFPESQDHVVPRSMMRTWSYLESGGSPGPKTPACLSCNSILSDHFYDSMADRCSSVRERILKRFGRDISRPDWSNSELMELDVKLREHVLRKQSEKLIHKRRAEWQSGSKFVELFESAYNQAIAEFPNNADFILFMKPGWIS